MVPDVGVVTDAVKQDHGLSVFIPPQLSDDAVAGLSSSEELEPMDPSVSVSRLRR
jgi:hypothetical protein